MYSPIVSALLFKSYGGKSWDYSPSKGYKKATWTPRNHELFLSSTESLFLGHSNHGVFSKAEMAILEGGLVQTGRIRVLKEAPTAARNKGAVVYWMFRDQRSRDNWALLHAVDLANRSGKQVAVAFNLFNRFLGAHARQLGFMIRGLRDLNDQLADLGIPFFLLRV